MKAKSRSLGYSGLDFTTGAKEPGSKPTWKCVLMFFFSSLSRGQFKYILSVKYVKLLKVSNVKLDFDTGCERKSETQSSNLFAGF